jgi:hypothetical protein
VNHPSTRHSNNHCLAQDDYVHCIIYFFETDLALRFSRSNTELINLWRKLNSSFLQSIRDAHRKILNIVQTSVIGEGIINFNTVHIIDLNIESGSPR